jgi:hypothetical protein
MPSTITPIDQSLTSVGAFADPYLVTTLPVGTSVIEAQILWSQVNGADGGIQVGFSGSPVPSFLRFATPLDRTARTNGQTILTTGETGDRLLYLYGTVTVASSTVLTFIRGQAQASPNATTLKAGSFLVSTLSPIVPISFPNFNVRLFGITGTVQLPSVHQRQWQADSVQTLMLPYQWSQLLLTNGATAVTSARNPDPLVRALRVEVQDGQSIRFEVTPPAANATTLATVNSPKLSGNVNLAFSANMQFSMIDASAVAP